MLTTLLLHGFDLDIERYTFYYQVLERLILLSQMKKKYYIWVLVEIAVYQSLINMITSTYL